MRFDSLITESGFGKKANKSRHNQYNTRLIRYRTGAGAPRGVGTGYHKAVRNVPMYRVTHTARDWQARLTLTSYSKIRKRNTSKCLTRGNMAYLLWFLEILTLGDLLK